jgi:hypothetical protein
MMNTLRALFAIATLLLTLVGPAGGQASQSATQISSPASFTNSAQAASSGGGTVYLPMVVNGKASTSSFDLIDQDIRSGKLTTEQGLTYKVFAQFSDARLPQKYLGSGVGQEGDLIMEDVINYNAAYTLSKTAEAILLPFFIPPDDSRSWFYLSKMGAAGQNEQQPQVTPASWLKVTTTNNKIDIFWLDSVPADAAKAAGLKAEFDRIIWTQLTKLMLKTPMADDSSDGGRLRIYLWNGYVDSDGTVVPFKQDILGITVGTKCDESPVVIYMPDRLPLGTLNSPGLIQYTTHEFMHAIQFSYTIKSCSNYRWLKEATATWAEDYVYKDAQSEQETAISYLNRPSVRLDDRTAMHDYGAYLLPYFLTHEVDKTASIIRLMWENAATTDNSYKAIDDAVSNFTAPGDVNWQKEYWAIFLETLWNKSPFMEYYNKNDKLTDSVAQAGGAPIQVSAAGKEDIIPLYGELPTGGALFFHLSIADNVRSLTILNGLSYKLKTGSAEDSGYFNGEITSGDESYQYEDLSEKDVQGATVETLMKVAGAGWQPEVIADPLGNNNQHSYCLDVQGKIEDMVVILSNGDFQNPDRIMKQQSIPTTIFANNMPCWKLTGTTKVVNYNAGVTLTVNGSNVTYGIFPSSVSTLPPYVSLPNIFPETQFYQMGADVNWSISGSQGNCVYSGGDSFHAGEHTTGGGWIMQLEPGLLPGSPTYRGYFGQGNPDEGEQISYNEACTDEHGKITNTTITEDAPEFFETPLDEFRDQIKVKSDGTLSGTFKHTEDIDNWTQYEWNLSGVTK